MIDTVLPPIIYGVWVKAHGWLKATNSRTHQVEALRFFHVEVAARVARRVSGRVEPIDDSLIDLERELLDTEKRSSISFRLNALFHKAKG
jgi:hypothetical protein